MALQTDAERLAGIIRDYREGEIPPPDAVHVLRWIEQFAAPVREPLLAEVTHVLHQSYFTKAAMLAFLEIVATSVKLAGDDPAAFWRGVSFLRLQQAGNSQRDMLALFDGVLQRLYGFTTAECGASPHTHVYLDDGVFTGGRVRHDIVHWIAQQAPVTARLAIVLVANHQGGRHYADVKIGEAATTAGKAIDVTWWSNMNLEDRKRWTDDADVLRPAAIPPEAQAYAAALTYPPTLRRGDGIGELRLFSNGAARNLLEQEFLKGGLRVRDMCPYLPDQMRPLGAMLLQTLGFGTMFVTYRNIANNTPLVLWAGEPWYPLFPRKTNTRQ